MVGLLSQEVDDLDEDSVPPDGTTTTTTSNTTTKLPHHSSSSTQHADLPPLAYDSDDDEDPVPPDGDGDRAQDIVPADSDDKVVNLSTRDVRRSAAANSNGTTSTTTNDANTKVLDEAVPRLPCMPVRAHEHREKTTPEQGLYNACVARPVKPAELKVNAKARAKMQEEWDRLRSVIKGCWDEAGVMEWSQVKRLAKAAGTKAVVGLVFYRSREEL